MFEFPHIEYLPLAAAMATLGLAALVFLRGPRRTVNISFAVGAFLFALQEIGVFLSLRIADGGASLVGVRLAMGARLLLPIPWLVFGLTFANGQAGKRLRAWAPAILCLAALGVTGVALLWSTSIYRVVRLPNLPQDIVALGELGKAAYFLVVVGLAAVLFTLESILRQSKGQARQRVKHLIIGLFAAFAAEVYAIGRFVLFSSVQAEGQLMESAALLVSTGLIGFAVARHRLFEVEVYISRHMVYRSATVALAGGYLVLLGMAGEALRRFEIPMRDFFFGVGLFIALLALVIGVFSERVRRQVKLYIDTHFYRHKHDHRQRWEEFTRSLGPTIRLEDVLSRLLDTLMRTVWVERAAVFLAERPGGDLVLVQAAGFPERQEDFPAEGASVPAGQVGPGAPAKLDRYLARIQFAGPLWTSLEAGRVVELGASSENGEREMCGRGLVLLAPMQGSEALLGALAVGPELTGNPFTAEDKSLLGTIAGQAATAIQTARLSQDLAAAKSMEAVHRVATFLLHDLKNCASVISMVAEQAKKQMGDPEFQREALEAVSSTAPKMRSLIATLSSLREFPEIEREPIYVEQIVGEVLEDLRKGFNDHVVVKTDLRPTPQVPGDHTQIARVVMNLLINAIEALDDSGELSVETFPEGSSACIRVRDTGCGIPEPHLRNGLFQPFRSTKQDGLGIGLYQCKTIVEAHGGRIEVESTKGLGTTFTVFLPTMESAQK